MNVRTEDGVPPHLQYACPRRVICLGLRTGMIERVNVFDNLDEEARLRGTDTIDTYIVEIEKICRRLVGRPPAVPRCVTPPRLFNRACTNDVIRSITLRRCMKEKNVMEGQRTDIDARMSFC